MTKNELATLADKERHFESLAADLQSAAGRTDAEDERTIVDYIRTQLAKIVPGALVEITPPAKTVGIDSAYGLHTQSRNIEISLTRAQEQTLIDMVFEDLSRYLNTLSKSLQKRLPFIHPEFATFSEINVRKGKIMGCIVGSSARLAAEISGELKIAFNREREILAKAKRERELAALARKHYHFESVAADLQKTAGRSDAEDEKTIVDYIRTQLATIIPGALVEVQDPTEAMAVKSWCGLDTQSRNIKISLTRDQVQASYRDSGFRYMKILSSALRKKLPLTPPEFARINFTHENLFMGNIVGSSAKLAAEISGELQNALAIVLPRAAGPAGRPEATL